MFFEPKEKHHVRGTPVVIKGLRHIPPELHSTVRDAALNFARRGHVVPSYSALNVQIGPEKRAHLGKSAHAVVDKRQPTLHINADHYHAMLRENPERHVKEHLDSSMARELSEVWRHHIHPAVQKAHDSHRKRHEKVHASYKQKEQAIDHTEAIEHLKQRLLLRIEFFLHHLRIDGISLHHEQLAESGENTYTTDRFIRLYRQAEESARLIAERFEQLRQSMSGDPHVAADAFMEALFDEANRIGEHMAYTICYPFRDSESNPHLEDLSKMAYTKYVYEYERNMVMHARTPVVSLSSGRGVIDFEQLKEGVR